MKAQTQTIIYTILADDKPVAALQATGTEARELLKEKWFHKELAALKVDSQPIYKSGTRLRARPATEEEWTVYDQECKEAADADEIEFVYLVGSPIRESRRGAETATALRITLAGPWERSAIDPTVRGGG